MSQIFETFIPKTEKHDHCDQKVSRNTVFGAEAQHAAAHLEDWLSAGIRHFRLEFAHESAEQVEGVTRDFEDALGGRLPARELARRLPRFSPEGITEGSLYVPPDYLTLPVLQ